jgi:hypothetical protein
VTTYDDKRQALGDALSAALEGTPLELTGLQQQAFDTKNEFDRRVAEINADTHLSVVGKNQAIAALREQTEATLAELQGAQQEQSAARRAALESQLLDRSAFDRDPATTIAWRDAAQRVAILEDTGDVRGAVSLLRQAIRNGDESLERSLLRAAIDQGWAEMVNAYADGRPRKADDVQELWSLTHAHQSGQLASREDILAGLADATAFNLNRSGQSNRVPTVPFGTPEAFTGWASETGITAGEA